MVAARGGKAPFRYCAHRVSVVGQGSWYIDEAHRPSAVAALRRGMDVGMTENDLARIGAAFARDANPRRLPAL
ncbi:hypothetical protein ACU5AX_10340 [Sphingomonas sp. XXL09]|uniref:hypothetical protein n=1 Tax=Sphingomonas sp. XXL09 TaxID=3457787 RepID=UPI00406BD0EE